LLVNECSELTVCVAKEMMNMNLRDGKNLTTWYTVTVCTAETKEHFTVQYVL
jgi:hypothetical protein